MRSALVITVGQSRFESFGALKLTNYLQRMGYRVATANDFNPLYDAGYDLYCFSIVFSWFLPKAAQWAAEAKRCGEVWIGGPAVTFHPANRQYIVNRTGINPTAGIDDRFEREPGNYPYAYFSRGCPAYTPACGICPVPIIEGNAFRYYPDAKPAALLLDNNLSALPDDYQDFIIQRFREHWPKGKLVDANSGFEPHTFTEKTLLRWKQFPLRYWRFGYDDLTERDQAIEMMRLLRRHGITGSKVRVYTLIGNEPIEDCHRRIKEVINFGFWPWPQRLRPLNHLGGPLPTRHDWDEPTLIAFQRFYSIQLLWQKLRPEAFYYQGRYPFRDAANGITA